MSKILIVDDEKDLVGLVSLHMKMAGHEPIIANDGKIGLELVRKENPDLIILDLMLPEIDGWNFCKILKAQQKNIPIIVLTACTQTEDKLKGFELGIDDYVTKPFSPRELVARVKRVLTRTGTPQSPLKKIETKNLEIDLENFQVIRSGKMVILTKIEESILKILVSKPHVLVTLEEFMNQVWGEDKFVEYGNISVHIRHLRNKIEEDPGNPQLIKTIKGLGYKFEV